MDKQPGDGGLAVYLAGLLEYSARAGHEVEVLHLVDRGGDVVAWPREYRLYRSYGTVQGQRLRAKLRSLLDAARPDIIHVHGCFTSISPVLLSEAGAAASMVGTLHDVRPFCYVMTRRYMPQNTLCDRICGAGCFTSGCVRPRDPIDALRLFRRWCVDAKTLGQWRGFDRVIAPSHFISDLAIRHGIEADRLRVIPHGVDVPEIAIPPAEAASPPLILFVGSMVEYKGILLLVRALSLLRHTDWRAVFVGDGPLRDEVRSKLKDAGLADRVDLIEQVASRAELKRLYARARLLTLPSIIPESFALVGIESLAVGTPVVTFALGGIDEWFREGVNGLAAADLDSADLARRIDQLLASADFARVLGENGRRLVARSFRRDDALENTLSVYRELPA